ncbi:MAG TPA: hypothetical protein VHN37_11335 [Actinomycetota bacterium]|nr:hypothetical protein [Actinomycetota bacterium]
MAGRRKALSTRRAFVCAVLAATAAVPASGATAASGDGPIVVSQLEANVSMTFGRREKGFMQKLAQTFVAPKEAHKLASLSLVLAGTDDAAVVKVYEVGKKPPFGTFLHEARVPVDAQWDGTTEWQTVRIRPALAVEPGERYSIVVRAASRRMRMGAAGGTNGYRRGQRWCYCPEWNGGIDYEAAHWQSDEELGYGNDDLMFKLRFWRKD